MELIIKEAIKGIGDPFLIILLVIIWMQFKMLIKRDDLLANLTGEIHTNGKLLAGLTALVEVLVYGRRHGNDT